MPFPYEFPIIFGELPSFQVLIDENIPNLLKGSLSIEHRIEERSIAGFTIVDLLGTATYQRGEPVEIWDNTDTLIFSGFIDTPGRARKGAIGSRLLHDIVCMDNHYLADKRLVVKSYTNQTLEYIVEDILTDYLIAEGITEGEIQTGPPIKSAIFNYVRVSETFDALSELSGFTWFIDELKKLYFVDRTTYAAPWDLDSSTYRAIKGSVHLSTGNPLYRNRQYIRGGKGLTSEQTETFTGDASTVAFTMGYPLALEPDVEVTNRTPVEQDVGIKGLETGEDCYWNKGDATITFEVAPENAETVTVVYYGQYPLIVQAVDPLDETARAAIEGGTGIVEDMVTEAQHESAVAMKESARAKLTQYCRDAEKFVYQTRQSGLAPGQLQAITHSPSGFTNHDMLIESVSVTTYGDLLLYNVSCITGPIMGSWAKFFSNILIRQDRQIRIGDSLLLVLLPQVESLALVGATDIHTDAFPPDVGRWIALPPTQGEGHHVRHEALALVEAPADTEHLTEDYKWDDGCKWGFATWG